MAFKLKAGNKGNPIHKNFPSAFKDYVEKSKGGKYFVQKSEDHDSSKPRTYENKSGILVPIEYHSHNLTRGAMRGGDEPKHKRKSQGIGSRQPR